MNDWRIGIENLKMIVKESRDESLSYSDKCALYAASRIILEDIKNEAIFHDKLDSYMKEKIGKSSYMIGSALGFDVGNSENADQHRIGALGQLQTLQQLLDERLPQDE